MRSRQSRKHTQHPLLCWDVASQAQFRQKGYFERLAFADAYRTQQWPFPFPVIDSADFGAIVLTDVRERIVWASPGFRTMTGYTIKSALHRKPSFLQGRDTDQAIRNTIRVALQARQRVSATITNYRRNGEPYQCYVDIVPLFSASGQLVNFMALEKEVLY